MRKDQRNREKRLNVVFSKLRVSLDVLAIMDDLYEFVDGEATMEEKMSSIYQHILDPAIVPTVSKGERAGDHKNHLFPHDGIPCKFLRHCFLVFGDGVQIQQVQ